MVKTIWIYWGQGWDKAPVLSQQCLKSWQYYNTQYEVNNIDWRFVEQHLPEIKLDIPQINLLTHASQSDIIRLYLLEKFGGVWVDSTCFCNKRLDDWLPDDTFLFTAEHPLAMTSSWFIKSSDDPHIIKTWRDSCIKYWQGRDRPHNYFWVHILFGACYNSDKIFKDIWDRQVKISSGITTGPHSFQPYTHTFRNPISPLLKKRVDDKVIPCFKLTNRVQYIPGYAVDHLFSTIHD